jgi:hypothetical protein
VTLLHCPALTEIDAGKSLLNWGFAVDGRVRPVGTLVGPRQLPAPSRSASAGRPSPSQPSPSQPSPSQQSTGQPSPSQQSTGRPAARAQSVASGPSVIAAAGFSCVALLTAGIGFAHSRRQRPRP